MKSATKRPATWAVAALWLMILAYAAYFSVLSIRLHAAHQTHLSDLGQIDQAIWNTSQGRFVEEIKVDQLSSRLTDHVEPIFAPVSLIFWLWDDVRALLVLQSLALALGAWPLFSIAFGRFRSEATALAFALAYLLYPPLQAANLAEFHALPLAAPLIGCAFLFAERRQWLRFAAAALLAAAVQEGLALLAALLGIYAIAIGLRQRSRQPGPLPRASRFTLPASRIPILSGLFVFLAGLLWFYIATFRIIPANAALAYGLEESPYVARFGALGDSFGQVVRTMLTRPLLTLQVVAEPLRLQYLGKLLAPVGFLALLGPEILLLGAPLLLANLLSAFPFQYSGLLHYSAPLAVYALMASVAGGCRMQRGLRQLGVLLDNRALLRACRKGWPLLAWLLGWSLASQVVAGFTPIGGQFRDEWPAVTEHQRLLSRFEAQIPLDAPLSTMASLYPHFSHRRFIYQFPVLSDAEYVLIDAAARSGWSRHPVEIRDQIAGLLESGQWAVQDAADGYLLLRADEQAAPLTIADLPDAFFDFARSDAAPQVPLDVAFTSPAGDRAIKLLGYDVIHSPRWRETAFRFYWQAANSPSGGQPPPDDLTLRAFFLAADGEIIDSTDLRPLIQSLWYPPSRWQAGETVVTDKLPWFMPKRFAIAAGVYQGDDWPGLSVAEVEANVNAGDARWRVSIAATNPASNTIQPEPFEDNTWVRLGAWQAQASSSPAAMQAGPIDPATLANAKSQDLTFGGDGWTVGLTGVSPLPRSAPGQQVPLYLRWQAENPAPRDYTIFVHLLDGEGRRVATADATPNWFGPLPTSQWPLHAPVLDAHTLRLPDDLDPGLYDVMIGWYYWETQERLALLDDAGLPVGDGAIVGQIAVDSTAGPPADLCCALSPACCASQ